MTEQTFKVRDKVYVMDGATWPDMVPSAKYPGQWTVEKVNPRTLGLRQGPRGLKADKALCTKELPEGYTSTTAGTSETVDLAVGQPYRTPWTQGTIVRWPAAKDNVGQTLFVIIRDDGGDRIKRMVPLGNETGRYWRDVLARALEEVKLDDLLAPGVEK